MSYPTIPIELPDPFEIINIYEQSLSSPSTGTNSTVVFWISQPISPNETALVVGSNIDTSSTIEMALLANSQVTSPFNTSSLSFLLWFANNAVQISTTTIKFTISSQHQQGVYAYRMVNSLSIPSAYFYINLPDIWFVQGNQGRNATPGGKIYVIGTCLALINGNNTYSPTLSLVDVNNIVTLISADSTWNSNIKIADYYQTFTVPFTVSLGTYSLYYHNGYGGDNAWSHINTFRSPTTPPTTIGNSSYPVMTNSITIEAVVSWPTFTVTMPAPVSSGTDDANMTIAIASLNTNGGGILSIPAGTYNFNLPIILTSKVTIIGSNIGTTILNWLITPTFSVSNPIPGLIMGKNLLIQGFWGWAKFSISNISITTTNTYAGNAIALVGNHTNDFSYIRNVTINITQGTTSATTSTGITISQTENIEISECIFTSTVSIYMLNVTYVRIFNNICNYGASNVRNEACWNTININNIFNISTGSTRYIFDGNIYGITFSGASGNLTSDNFVGNNLCQNYDVGNLGVMSFENENGAFIGAGVVANGTLLTFPSTLPTGGNTYGVVMILSGTGQGQWRYVVNGTRTTTTTLNIVTTWTIVPDINSIISVVGLTGRTIFAGNSYLTAGSWNNSYYQTLGVIEANNISTNDAPATYVGARFPTSIQPGWFYMILNNISQPSIYLTTTSANYFTLSLTVTGYTQYAFVSYQIYRNNIFDSNVLGGINVQANQSVVSFIIENNSIPSINFSASTGMSISDTIIRGNISSTASALLVTYNPTGLASGILSL
jgi:hypothetical protein